MSEYDPASADLNRNQNTVLDHFRSSRVGRAVTLVSTLGAGLLPVAEASAQGPVQPSKVTGLYTMLSPDQVAQDIQAAIPGAQVAQEFSVNSTTFSVRSADGTSESMPATSSYQDQLNKVGNEIISSIPNASIGKTQSVQGIERTPEGDISATYVCPPNSSNPVNINFSSIKIEPGNKVDAEFCPSDQKIKITPVAWNDNGILKALNKFRNDPLRSGEPWTGDKYNKDPWQLCPDIPRKQDPQTKFSLSPDKQSVKVGYSFIGVGDYCDLMGQESEQFTVEVKHPGSKKFTQVGNTLLHVAGVQDVLVGSYDAPLKYARTSEVFKGLGKICTGPNSKHTSMRIKTVVRFVANPHQTFKHNYRGGSDLLRSAKSTFVSSPKEVCA